MTEMNRELLAPCGLYCGVCAVYIATRDDNVKFKERLTGVYGVALEDVHCRGCLSSEPFVYCATCPIKDCVRGREYEGCHECSEFPCALIDEFPMPVGKKVIMRTTPAWRELGTERFVEEEEKRYHCPECGYALFRGAMRCRGCGVEIDVD